MNNLTIFHYHLLPGGVTDVVVLSIRALLNHWEELGRVRLVYGREDNTDKVREKIIKGLDRALADKLDMVLYRDINYSEFVESPQDARELARDLMHRFGGDDDLWMIHNYQLGKNPTFTQALLLCIENREQKFLFQIHDFPECSRYANLARLKAGTDRNLYPQRENVAYCVINSRDYRYLVDGGIREENLWLLNNPVPLGSTTKADKEAVKSALYERYRRDFPAMKPGAKLLFYPVRSIRRKNVFEAAYLIKLLERDVNFLISLPGVSRSEKPYSDLVEKAFREGLIPGMWGIGMDEETDLINYMNFWAAADVIISPSIQEGFGYLYLNALHWEKPLFTRYLDIMEGFRPLFSEESSHFYSEVPVPLSREESERLKENYRRKIDSLGDLMPRSQRDLLESRLDEVVGDDRVCFSYLSPREQYEILKKLEEDADFRISARDLNRESLDRLTSLLDAVVTNRDGDIDKTFGEAPYARVFRSIMKGLERGCRAVPDDGADIQGNLEKTFFSLPYLRLLYGE